MVLKILNSHQSIIVVDGALPDKQILSSINTQVPIIAADGAANQFEALGLSPQFIIGDGDGYHRLSQEKKETFIKIEEQDSTDFEKCIVFAQKSQLLPSLVLGINGGEYDHILGNAQVFLKYADCFNVYFLDTYVNPERKSIGRKLGVPLTQGKSVLNVKKGSLLSLISFHNSLISTKGLQWELKDHTLSINGILGLRNRALMNQIEFDVQKGKVLLIVDISDQEQE